MAKGQRGAETGTVTVRGRRCTIPPVSTLLLPALEGQTGTDRQKRQRDRETKEAEGQRDKQEQRGPIEK